MNKMSTMQAAYHIGYRDAIEGRDPDVSGISHSWLVDEYDLGYDAGIQDLNKAADRQRQIDFSPFHN